MICNVVCIQTYPFLCDKAKNINKMIELLEKAVSEKPDTQLVVFPELATTGYECGEKFKELAEVIDDKSETVIKETYSNEELEKMRDSAENIRDLALIDILASTGMRIGELVLLNRERFDFNNIS